MRSDKHHSRAYPRQVSRYPRQVSRQSGSLCFGMVDRLKPHQRCWLMAQAAAEAVAKLQNELGMDAGGSPGSGVGVLAAMSCWVLEIGGLLVSCTASKGSMFHSPRDAGRFIPGQPQASPDADAKRSEYQSKHIQRRARNIEEGTMTFEDMKETSVVNLETQQDESLPDAQSNRLMISPAPTGPPVEPSPALNSDEPSTLCASNQTVTKPDSKGMYSNGVYWRLLGLIWRINGELLFLTYSIWVPKTNVHLKGWGGRLLSPIPYSSLVVVG